MNEEAGESEPIHLEFVDALELYGLIIGATAVQAGDQLRDAAGLESALVRPRMYAHYEAADLALQASVLAHGIAESQTFVDGNKRLALVAMLTFLSVNGYRSMLLILTSPNGSSASAPMRRQSRSRNVFAPRCDRTRSSVGQCWTTPDRDRAVPLWDGVRLGIGAPSGQRR